LAMPKFTIYPPQTILINIIMSIFLISDIMDREDVSTTISATKTTTIAVSRETKEVLRRIGEKGESYDDIIRGLLSKIAWEEADKRWNKILEEDEFILYSSGRVMTFRVFISRTFQRQFYSLPEEMQERIREGLQVLKKDPFKARPSADIKPLKDTNPRKYRLRVGNYRIIYCVESDAVKVIELFKRERGYR